MTDWVGVGEVTDVRWVWTDVIWIVTYVVTRV